MPQGFYRPISLQALQIECEYGEIEDKFREILLWSSYSEIIDLLKMSPWKKLSRLFSLNELDLYVENNWCVFVLRFG